MKLQISIFDIGYEEAQRNYFKEVTKEPAKQTIWLIYGSRGCRAGKYCLTNLLAFWEDITVIADKAKSVDVIPLDSQKCISQDSAPEMSSHDSMSHTVPKEGGCCLQDWLNCPRKRQLSMETFQRETKITFESSAYIIISK